VEVGSLRRKLGSLTKAMVLGAATNCYVHIGMSHIKDECQVSRKKNGSLLGREREALP
jgi:hypothetical protein